MQESNFKKFNHLKIHTQYSICEGAIKIDELKDVAKDFSSKGITVKEDERGKIVKFKRRVNRADGTSNPAPKLVDSAKNSIDVLVGNGSQVKVMYNEYDWNYAGKSGVGLDLQAVQVIDLIPYGEEFDKVDGFVATDSVDEF